MRRRKVRNAKGLLRRTEHNRIANEARDDQTRQRKFERSFESRDLPDSEAARADASDGGRCVRKIEIHLDAGYHRERRERLIRQAAVGLSGTLKRILWGIFRGEDRRERIKLSGVPKTTYFWGLEKLLKLFCGQ